MLLGSWTGRIAVIIFVSYFDDFLAIIDESAGAAPGLLQTASRRFDYDAELAEDIY